MTDERRRYLAYLVRLWQTRSDGDQIWRASLERPDTGERLGFASLEDLIDFLLAQTRPPDESNDSKRGPLPPPGSRA